MIQPDDPLSRSGRPPLARRIGHAGRRLLSGWTGRLINLLFLLLSVFVIGGVLLGNRETLQTFTWQIRPAYLLLVAGAFLVDLLVATWAWHLLVARLAGFRNFRRSARICWQSNLARRIPTPVWYIAGRAMLYEREGVSKITTSLLSTLELIFFFVSGLVTTLLTLPFWALPAGLSGRVTQGWLLALLLGLSGLLVHPRVLTAVWRRLRSQSQPQPLQWRDTVSWLATYVLTWVLGALVLYGVINLLHPLPLRHMMAVIGIWSLAGSISLAGALTISVIGVREISLTLLLTLLVPAPIALIAAILIRVVWLVGELFSALLALLL